MEWFVNINGEPKAPFSEREVSDLLTEVKITTENLAYAEGQNRLAEIKKVHKLFAIQLQQNQSVMETQTTSANPSEDWKMQTKDIPFWKFILAANLFKMNQLDFAEKSGGTITIRARNGKEISGTADELECTIMMKNDLRDFSVKNANKKGQLTFRETHYQMDEEWWDDLQKKIGAEESKSSKALGFLSDWFG